MEKAQKELECLREFQNSGAVIAINAMLTNPVIRKKNDERSRNLGDR